MPIRLLDMIQQQTGCYINYNILPQPRKEVRIVVSLEFNDTFL